MKNSHSVINVACIVRDFMKNEARTIKVSKGKMINDDIEAKEIRTYLQVG